MSIIVHVRTSKTAARHEPKQEVNTMEKYLDSIEQAGTLDTLDQITEAAAMDDTLTGAQYEAVYAAALHKAQTWDPQNRERREHPAQEPQYTAETYKDNAGRLHLAVLDSAGECVYYLTDADIALVMDTLAALVSGGDPIADQWEGGEPDPAATYKWITQTVEARNGGAWEIDAVQAMRGGTRE